MAPARDLRWLATKAHAESIRYLLFDRELDNFTYPIANIAALADFIAEAFDTDPITVRRYIDELAGDEVLARALDAARNAVGSNRSMPFGRRLGWYAIARLRRPELIVETGVHDGLGSTTLLRALQRNDAEASPGTLLSIDRRPAVGLAHPSTSCVHATTSSWATRWSRSRA